ncbi:MAG: transcriptional repressor LexA [Clostridiales Family XIII bacterium]|jgi:repressor LexA|nr:transcriptional repressor LexA [Clostridiales Family XIII bacterium]
MSKKSEIDIRRSRILEFINATLAEKGYPPTVREILAKINIKSISTVHADLKILEKVGLLRIDKNKTRALSITNKGKQVLKPQNAKVEHNEPIVFVPIVGEIAAGKPIKADENIEAYMPLQERFVKGESFSLRVKGDSMINKGIFDGDYIIIRKQDTAYNGEIVVALITNFDSEATVKTFYRERSYIKLVPENDYMEPIIITDINSLKILGIVTGVFRFM